MKTAWDKTKNKTLPSYFQLNEKVGFEFSKNLSGKIIKIHFTKDDVLYDVEAIFILRIDEGYGEVKDNVRFYNLNGRFILKQD